MEAYGFRGRVEFKKPETQRIYHGKEIEIKKVERGHWAYRNGELVPFEEEEKEVDAPFVITDERDAFLSHVDNKMYTSMSRYRRMLKDKNVIELGNDRMPTSVKPPSREERLREIREDFQEAERQVKWGMAPCTEKEKEHWKREKRKLNKEPLI